MKKKKSNTESVVYVERTISTVWLALAKGFKKCLEMS